MERRGTHVMFGVGAWRGEICMRTRLYANLNEWINAEHDSEAKQAHPLAPLIQTYLCSLFSGYLVGLVIVPPRLHFKAGLLGKRYVGVDFTQITGWVVGPGYGIGYLY